MTVVGIDGCKTGWIAVALGHGDGPVAHHLGHLRDLESAVPDVSIIGIDIPLSFPTGGGHRQAEIDAKVALGSRASTIFFTPAREVLLAESHVEATRRNVTLTGKGLSRQSFGLAAKVLEADAWLTSGRQPCRVAEVHPELSFYEMLGGRPARSSKKTWAGMVERRDALRSHGIDLDHLDDPSAEAGRHALVDDMLDAAAVAWSAGRILDGSARSFPDQPVHDADGRDACIWR